MKDRPASPTLARRPAAPKVSMGELSYFSLLLDRLLCSPSFTSEERSRVDAEIARFCPKLAQARAAGFLNEWSTLSFTWRVPLPAAFEEESRRRAVAREAAGREEVAR